MKSIVFILSVSAVLFAMTLQVKAVDAPSAANGLTDDGWASLFREGTLTIFAQRSSTARRTAFKAEGVIDAPIDRVLAVLGNTAIAEEWIPNLKRQVVLQESGEFEVVTMSEYRVPFPFDNREILLVSRLDIDREAGCLVADARSVDIDGEPTRQGVIRAHMHRSLTRLAPAANGKTWISFMLLVDPRGGIPGFLADLGLRVVPHQFVRALETRAQTAEFPLRPSHDRLIDELAGGAPSPSLFGVPSR
jgi:hypothetical protein